MRAVLVARRSDGLEPHFDGERGLARRQPGAVGDPKNMRVDRDGRLAKRDVQHHIGGLAPDPGQPLQGLAVARHDAAMLLDQHA